MTSRLLSALDARIAKTHDAIESACLRAERAALFARQGRLETARAELAALRAGFVRDPHPLTSAWASLAEGLVEYFEHLDPAARGKIARALALSSAFNATHVRALSAAWLAHMDYALQHFEPMVQHLAIARAEDVSEFNDARSRASLVTAQAYHWAERFDLALPWYTQARRYAADDGDEQTLSALMHNMGWLHAFNARRAAAEGDSPGNLRQVLLGVDSSSNFSRRIGETSLASLAPALRAYVLALLGRHAEALALFDANLAPALDEGLARSRCAVLAEIAWCRVNAGDAQRALAEAQDAEAHIAACELPEDRAASHGRLAQFYAARGARAKAKQHRERAQDEWRTHAANQRRLVDLLASIEASAPASQ